MTSPVVPSPTPPGGVPQSGLPAGLLADLADWTLHLHARSYTQVSVDMLLHDLRRAVPSALGYTLVLVPAAGLPTVSISVAAERLPAAQVASTLTFQLPVGHDLSAGAVFYAGLHGRFDALAALLRRSASFGTVRLGGPPAADVEPGVHGLDDHTRVNYAVGVLLGRGRSVEQARGDLAGLAVRHGSLQDAAEHVLLTFGG